MENNSVLKIVPASQFLAEVWDNFQDENAQGLFYTRHWVLNILCNKNWKALCIGHRDHLKAVLPFAIAHRLGLPYVFQPHFAQQFGYCSQMETEVPAVCIKELVKQCPAGIYAFAEMNKLPPLPRSVKVRLRANHIISLGQSVKELESGYNQNTKRNIGKAKRAGLQVTKSLNVSDMVVLTNIFKTGKGPELKEVKTRNYQTIINLASEAFKRNSGFLLLVNDDSNTLIAGTLFVHCGGRITYLFAANTPQAKSIGASHLIIDYLISVCGGGSEFHTLDFEGGNDPGTARFYKGFGGRETFYPLISWNRYWPGIRTLFPF